MSRTIKVKFGNHFKVEVPRENADAFEMELNRYGVNYFVDSNKKMMQRSVTYSILKNSSEIVEKLLSVNNYDAAHKGAVVFAEDSEERKIMNLYLKLLGIFTVLMVVLQLFDKFIRP